MTQRKLERLRGEIAKERKAKIVKSRTVQRIAKQIGLRLHGKRGKEPTYIHDQITNLRPVSIPNHPTLAIGTKNNILDALELYLDEYEEGIIKATANSNGALEKGRRGVS